LLSKSSYAYLLSLSCDFSLSSQRIYTF
jgi:hypothetical protein